MLARIRGEEPTISRTPRPRRQIRPATLRLARIFGFRFDRGRDAYVLRLIGKRFGPVLRTTPHDSAAEAIEWPVELRRQEARRRFERRRTRRFVRDEQPDSAEKPLRH